MRRLVVFLGFALVISACGKDSPTAPSQPSTPTRIIRLEANMDFGTVNVGDSVERILRIYNDGTDALTISGMTGPGAGSVVTASWTSGSIAPGTSQASTIRFTPTTAQTYSGTMTVNGNQTSGTNTVAFRAIGEFPPRPNFVHSGVGVSVFDMPPDVQRVRIIGTYAGSCQNFIVHLRGRGLVNEILGTCSIGIGARYDGTHQTNGGGTVEVLNASGVSWSFQEVR